MFFCPKCDYTFDLSKNIEKKENKSKKIISNITQISDILKEYKDSEIDFIENYIFKNDENKIITLPEFLNLDKKKQNFVKNYTINYQYNSKINFICKNCNYTQELNETIRLYQSDLNLKNKAKDNTPEINSLYLDDPTLPRTNNCICKNINCPSLNDNKNHVVFYRNFDSTITYVCNTCRYSWIN